jgi:hypothetical protein
MTLLEVQRRMANAIFQPLTRSDRMAGGADAEFIKPNNRLTSLERLEIYGRSYWFRIIDSLYDDFPGLRAVLGERAFRRLSRAYLADCPSRSFTLRNLGSRLEDWLRRNPQYAGNRHTLALEMVRLEWADIEAFDSAADKVLGPEDLLELDADFRASLQPYVRLLALQYPVDDLRIQVRRTSEDRGAASNTALKQKHRTMTERVARSNPTQSSSLRIGWITRFIIADSPPRNICFSWRFRTGCASGKRLTSHSRTAPHRWRNNSRCSQHGSRPGRNSDGCVLHSQRKRG